jgi:hypothetical protein
MLISRFEALNIGYRFETVRSCEFCTIHGSWPVVKLNVMLWLYTLTSSVT